MASPNSTTTVVASPADRLVTLPDGAPDLTLGYAVAAWMERWLVQPNGPRARKPFRLVDSQLRFLAWWYAVDGEGNWLYQHAVRHGAVDDLLGRPAEPGGAELVQLRKSVRGSVKVQHQPPQEPDADGRTAIELQLMEAVRAVRTEEFEARGGDHCARCTFQSICPVKGAGTVLS